MKSPARTVMGFGNLMNTLTLQQQLRLMTGISLIGMLAVIIFVMSSLNQLQHEFSDYQLMQLTDKSLIEINATALAISRADPILPDTAARLDEADTHIQALRQRLAGLPGKSEPGKPELDKLLGEISGKWNAYVQGFRGAIKIASDNPNDALMIPDSLFTMHLAPMTRSVENFIAANKASEIASEEKITSVMSKILWIVLLPMILLGAMTLVTQTLFGLHLRQRLDGIVGEINHLHNGDLTRRLPATNHDEIGHLSRTINNFIARFETILHGVYASAEHAHNTAAEVSLMAHSVTKNAKEQSTRVFEVSNAIEGMGGTVRKIAESASNASGITKQALAMVHSGGETGQATIAALGKIDHTVATSAATIAELNTAIQRIGSVSGSIKDIAEQTNLLALNAAIEAARAGEQGRGFAVVADEVRKLAGRTTSATADITQIVQDIENKIQQAIHAMDLTQQEVSQGVLFGETMGKLLDQIEASVQTVTGLMDQIASATEDQSSAGEHISRNISTVADISADTAANIELAHNEMSSLAKTSKTLYETVGQFKLAA